MAAVKKINTPEKSNKNAAKTKKTPSNKGGNKKNHKKYKKQQDAVREDIILIVTLVVSLLLILSYINLCGAVGNGINYIVFGTIGILGYLFPFILFFGVAFYLANRQNNVLNIKLISTIVFIFAIASLIQIISRYDPEISIFGYFEKCGKAGNGGGLIGSILLKIFYTNFGAVATVIILIAILLICFMLITGKTIITYIKGAGKVAFNSRIDAIRVRREERYEEYGDDEEDEEEDEGVIKNNKKRSAKIVNLRKDNISENAEEEEEEEGTQSFIDALKSMSNKRKKKENIIVEMQEIIPEQIPEKDSKLSITGSYLTTEGSSIYEEELKRKFGDSQISADIYEADKAENKKIEKNNFDKESNTESVFDEEQDIFEEISIKNKFIEDESIEEISIEEISIEEELIEEKHIQEKPIADKPIEEAIVYKPVAQKTEHDSASEMPDIIPIAELDKKYTFPSIDFLGKPPVTMKKMTEKDLKSTAHKLESTLESFGVKVSVTNISCGPAVTRYELQPEQGVKVSKITALSDDIKLNLAASDIRIEAPISGKAAVGIEVPNKEISSVYLRELIEHNDFIKHSSDLAFAVGKDISGQAVVTDIAKMPHLLIAGATGSGKSVCINTLIMSILYKAKPSDVRLIMIDPKVVELSVYNGIPHLLIPVVTDPKQASAALNWAVMEMTDRYSKFAEFGVRDLKGYNAKVSEMEETEGAEKTEASKHHKIPQMVIIVDELADLMMVASKEVETAICRLAQMARAAGMHLIIATQRPSVNVITGVIKANVPSRIAFAVSSAIDSRTIIDGSGAESLLGKGDMLFFPSGIPKPIRVQGAFVSDKEVSSVVEFLKEQNETINYNTQVSEQITNAAQITEISSSSASGSGLNDKDDYFVEAGRFIIEKDKASIGMLQRIYKIGFNRAARIMDQLADAGVVGPEEGTKPRKILMTMEEFEQYNS